MRGILAECGMTAERHVPIALPRGGVATVDVRATEVVQGIVSTIICECKNWKTNIPQEVVFGFRTVMIEAGANRGYVISKAGFQAGAILAANATNIELVTFEAFQGRFFDKWIAARTWSLEHAVGSIGTYYEPFGIPGMDKIEDEAERDRYFQVWRKYFFVGAILPGFSPYMRTLGQAPPLPALPINLDGVANYEIALPDDLAEAKGYQEFLELLENYARYGLEALRALNPNTRGRAPETVERDD